MNNNFLSGLGIVLLCESAVAVPAGTTIDGGNTIHKTDVITPGAKWKDLEGKEIQAHGGGILHYKGVYYWYGEDKADGYLNYIGVSCYSSKDLVHWDHVSTALPSQSMPAEYGAKGILERPKVIFNSKTDKFVMWMHLDHPGYSHSVAGVAISDSPQGPFKYLGELSPIQGSTYRDMNLYKDRNGAAYAIFSGDNNASLYAVELNADYTNVKTPMIEGTTWAQIVPNESREAPAPFYYNGHYYLLSSGTSGWAPNAAECYEAPHILGPWHSIGNPFVGKESNTTFNSQSTFVLPVAKHPGCFIYMGDRWNPGNLADSRYIWLPFKVHKDGTFHIHWRDSWSLSLFNHWTSPVKE